LYHSSENSADVVTHLQHTGRRVQQQAKDSSLVHHNQILQTTSKKQHQIPQRKHQVGKRSKTSGNKNSM